MFRFLAMMLIPLWILIYTVQFGRWVGRRGNWLGATAAWGVGVVAFGAAGFILWRVTA